MKLIEANTKLSWEMVHLDLTVRDAMKIDPLKKGKVVAGSDKLDSIITGITIIEAPDIINWLEGGEMLLTSLYSTRDLDIDYRETVKRMVEKSVSALVIKTGRFVDIIPPAIIESANEFGLPIIELEGNIRFIDVMYPVMAELFNHQVRKLKYYKEVQERFTTLALECEGLQSIVNTLKELVGNPIAIFDRNHHCLACTDPERNLNRFYEATDPSRGENLDGKFYYYSHTAVLEGDEGREVSQVVVPIKAFGQIKGYLTVFETEKPLQELDFTSLTSAATVVSLDMVKRFAISEVEQKYKNDLIDNLVTGRIDSKRTVLERADLIGWDLHKPFTVMIINIENVNDYLVQNRHANGNDNKMLLDKIHSDVFYIVQGVVNKQIKGNIIGTKGDSIIVLWPGDSQNSLLPEIMKKAAKKIQAETKKRLKKISVAIGIGNNAETIEEIAKSYQEALDAIVFGKMIDANESISSFADLGVFRMLCKFAERNSLQEFVPEPLLRLIEHDKNNESGFLNTLEVFLECNCNASKAAKELFIHYKTILYRLERIKEITKLDLEKEKDRLELQMGLKILRLLNNEITK